MRNLSQIKVWDPMVRLFHWVLVFTFLVAYITEEEYLTLHIWAGYVLSVSLTVRIVWGFIGTPYARFSDFVTHPKKVFQYIQKLFSLRAKRFIGHNPAGGAMILLLLASLVMTALSGMLLLAPTEHVGPFVLFNTVITDHYIDVLEETHEFFANFSVFLVFVHIAGVVFESIIHRENLVLAMINGFKRSNPPVKRGEPQ